MTKYIIVDDEPIAHDIIKGYCDAFPHLTLVQRCYDAIEAMECLRKHQVDLIFLDLNMPKLKGFEFLKAVERPPQIIVTTAYQEYALEGYELNIVDYLLKPISFERFVKALNKVDTENKGPVDASVREEAGSLFLKSNKKRIQVILGEVLFVEATGNYIKIVLKDREIQVREKISEMVKLLPQSDFLQVHKSFIVSKRHIHEVEGNRVLIKDFIIPVGKTYQHNLRKLF